MSDTSMILCRVIRPLWCAGRSYPAGAIFKATPRNAALILESTRGELVNPADFALIRAASQAETGAALVLAGKPWR